MDIFNSVNQCTFCGYLNTYHADRCNLCDELLNRRNLLLLSNLLATPRIAHCPRCDRQLLHNHVSCTFCNAHWSGTSVGTTANFSPQSIFVNVPAVVNIEPNMQEHWNEMVMLSLLPPIQQQQRWFTDNVTPLTHTAWERLRQPASDAAQDPARNTCGICLEPPSLPDANSGDTSSNSVITLPCCHNMFHVQCIEPWFLRHCTCPMCRHNLNELLSSQ